MATIAENLQNLNDTKQAIKTAIEAKGQDLTDTPFTKYAEKITAIEIGKKFTQGTVTFTGESSQATIIHNLGAIPSIFVLFPLIPKSELKQNFTYGFRYMAMGKYGTLEEISPADVSQTLEYSSTTTLINWQTSTARQPVATETSLTTGYRSVSYLIPAGIQFGWIAIE